MSVLDPTRSGICWADFSSDSDSDFPLRRTETAQTGSTPSGTSFHCTPKCADTTSKYTEHASQGRRQTPEKVKPSLPRRFSTNTGSPTSPCYTYASSTTRSSSNYEDPIKKTEDLETQVVQLRGQVEAAQTTCSEQQDMFQLCERDWSSRVMKAEHSLEQMESKWWEWFAAESQKVLKLEHERYAKLLDTERIKYTKRLDAERALSARQLAVATQSLEAATTEFERQQVVWEEERITFNNTTATYVTEHKQWEADIEVCHRKCEEMEERREGECETLRTQEEEMQRLRETTQANLATLKQIRKDHNTKVQLLQAKIDFERAAGHRKKTSLRDVGSQSDQMATELHRVNQQMVGKLVDERRVCQDAIQQKNDMEEQLDVATAQLDDMHGHNGTLRRDIKNQIRHLREIRAQKDEAVKSAECFHDQNKRLLEERVSLMAQIRSLHKQITARIWNDKIMETHGPRLASIFMDTGKAPPPARSPAENSTTGDEVEV